MISGMLLRDYLAAAAMAAEIQVGGEGSIAKAARLIGIEPEEYDAEKHWPQVVAKSCYVFADAMLAERKKKKK